METTDKKREKVLKQHLRRMNDELTKEEIKSVSKYIRNKRLVSDRVINAVYEANKKDM